MLAPCCLLHCFEAIKTLPQLERHRQRRCFAFGSKPYTVGATLIMYFYICKQQHRRTSTTCCAVASPVMPSDCRSLLSKAKKPKKSRASHKPRRAKPNAEKKKNEAKPSQARCRGKKNEATSSQDKPSRAKPDAEKKKKGPRAKPSEPSQKSRAKPDAEKKKEARPR